MNKGPSPYRRSFQPVLMPLESPSPQLYRRYSSPALQNSKTSERNDVKPPIVKRRPIKGPSPYKKSSQQVLIPLGSPSPQLDRRHSSPEIQGIRSNSSRTPTTRKLFVPSPISR